MAGEPEEPAVINIVLYYSRAGKLSVRAAILRIMKDIFRSETARTSLNNNNNNNVSPNQVIYTPGHVYAAQRAREKYSIVKAIYNIYLYGEKREPNPDF